MRPTKEVGHPKASTLPPALPPLSSLPTLPETNRMASLVNSLHSRTKKAEERPPFHHPTLRCGSLRHLPGAVSPTIASLPGGFFLELLVFPHFFRVFVLWEGGWGVGGKEEGGTRVSWTDFGVPAGGPAASEGFEGTRAFARFIPGGTPPMGQQRPLLPWGVLRTVEALRDRLSLPAS